MKPTRPLASYIFFSNENVPKIKSETGCGHKEAMTKAGELWGKMNDKEKAPYIKKNELDKARYNN